MGIGAQELAKLARLRICAGCGCVTLCHVSTAISGIVQPHYYEDKHSQRPRKKGASERTYYVTASQMISRDKSINYLKCRAYRERMFQGGLVE